MTGKAEPPIDEDEATRRREVRDQSGVTEANRIRDRVTAAGIARDVPTDVIKGTVGRRLREKGFESFAKTEEIQAADRLDRFDADRREKRPSDVDAPATGEPIAASGSLEQVRSPTGLVRIQRPPRRKSRASVERTREELFRALASIE